jgi:hypothetical protein
MNPVSGLKNFRNGCRMALIDNPFLKKRLRSSLRGNRFFILLIGYLLVLSVALGLIYVQVAAEIYYATPMAMNQAGVIIFLWVMGLQALLVCILSATVSATYIASEKEKQTFDMLKMITFSTPKMILGEVLASGGYILLLVIATLPVTGLVFLVGGISPLEYLQSYLALVLAAIMLGAFGIMNSALQPKVSKAVNSSVGALIFLAIFTSSIVQFEQLELIACFNPALLLVDVAGSGFFVPTVFGISMKPVLASLVLCTVATLYFMLIASRKVFDTSVRALTPWQYAFFMYGMIFLLIADGWDVIKSGYPTVLIGFMLLMMLYCVNHLTHPNSEEYRHFQSGKKKRPDRLWLFGFHVLLGNGIVHGWLFLMDPTVQKSPAILCFFIAALFLLAVRSLTGLAVQISADRSKTIRNALLLMLSISLLPPIVGVIGLLGTESAIEYTAYNHVWYSLISTFPGVALLELFSQMNFFIPEPLWSPFKDTVTPWVACFVYYMGILIFCTGAITLLKGRKKVRTEKKTNIDSTIQQGVTG